MAAQDPPAAAALDLAGLEGALANNERIRKSTDLPLFYAQKEKDVCTAELFMERFEVAAQIARWILPEGEPNRYQRTCREFYLLLRGNALKWWASLDNCLDFDKTNWITVKARFLESYAKQYTPTSACTGLSEMKQRPTETVQDYFVRCNEIYDRIKDIRPGALEVWRGPLPQGVNNNDQLNRGKSQGTKEMGLFFLHLLFVAGLRDDIKLKTMEMNDANLEEARVTAKRIELLLHDKKAQRVMNIRNHQLSGQQLPESSDTSDTEEISSDEFYALMDEEVGQLNAIRAQKGKRAFHPRNNYSRRNFKRDLKKIVCHYCKKVGHYQKVCRKRLKENGNMVFYKGNDNSNNISEDQEQKQDKTDEPSPAAMSISDYYHINMIQSLN